MRVRAWLIAAGMCAAYLTVCWGATAPAHAEGFTCQRTYYAAPSPEATPVPCDPDSPDANGQSVLIAAVALGVLTGIVVGGVLGLIKT